MEQRYRAVLEVEAGAAGDRGRRAVSGCPGRRCIAWLGRYRAAGPGRAWRTARTGRMQHPASDGAGGGGGGLRAAPDASAVGSAAAACSSWAATAVRPGAVAEHGLPGPGPPRPGRRRCRDGVAGRTTSAGSGTGRWSCGSWTSSAACFLADGTECKVVTGIDDHSRFCVIAAVVRRATGRAVAWRSPRRCAAYGVPGGGADRQRQAVHRPVHQAPPGRGAVRADLPGERHHRTG